MRPPRKDAWINGGSPTKGFLGLRRRRTVRRHVPPASPGTTWADWLFMLGLLGIGVGSDPRRRDALATAAAGALLLVMMWTAVLPPENNLFMDDHLIYAMVLVLLAAIGAGHTFGLGTWWAADPDGAPSPLAPVNERMSRTPAGVRLIVASTRFRGAIRDHFRSQFDAEAVVLHAWKPPTAYDDIVDGEVRLSWSRGSGAVGQ